MKKKLLELENKYECKIPEKRVKTWEIQLEMWKCFDRICQENNLKYFFFWGSLLGAVRHEGFIPWDDDIDIVMPREDYDKFELLADKYIQMPLFLKSAKSTEGFYWSLQIINTNTSCVRTQAMDDPELHQQGMALDIVPLDIVPSNKIDRRIHYIHMKMDFSMLNKHVDRWKNLGIKGKIIKALSYLYYFGMSREKQIRRTEKIRTVKQLNNSLEVSDSVHFHRYPKEWFDEAEYLQFEENQVPVPVEYKEVLVDLYGDYMRLPDLKNRKIQDDQAAGWFVDPDISYREYSEIIKMRKNSIINETKKSYHAYCDK